MKMPEEKRGISMINSNNDLLMNGGSRRSTNSSHRRADDQAPLVEEDPFGEIRVYNTMCDGSDCSSSSDGTGMDANADTATAGF
jgi:hypothetical protein